MDLPVSPLAPKNVAQLDDIDGVRLFVGNSGIKYQNRPDILLAVFDEDSSVAGVFTKSKTRAASIDWCKKNLINELPRALLVNAGNANAFTGEKGIKSVQECANKVAETVDCKPFEVFLASTGVIGEPLPHEKITSKLEEIYSGAQANWEEAAKAITTTDTFIKTSTAKAGNITVNGIAKGSGMIEPDMATMLCYIFTDAKIEFEKLQELVSAFNERTFNAITVDSDTSTSDMLLAFATNKNEIKDENEFEVALFAVMKDLAHQVVKDGEGATKFIEVEVTSAEDNEAAQKIAKSIANSPLIKTAIAGEDANWGRVVMAVGKSGEEADRDKLRIKFGDLLVSENGEVSSEYNEELASNYMKNQEIRISVDVGVSDGHGIVWTCDLTHQYISINADYRS